MTYRNFLWRWVIAGLFVSLGTASVFCHPNKQARDGNDQAADKVISSFSGKSFSELYARFAGQLVQPLPEDAQRVVAARYLSRLEAVPDGQLNLRVRHELEPILQLYHQERINILIYQNINPAASTIPGSFLMLSTGLLEAATTTDQLRAVVAHELTHDLLFRLASRALLSDDYSLMREIEMMCDGFSVAALAELKGDLSSVQEIMRKVLIEDDIHRRASFTHPILRTRLKVVAALSNALIAKGNS